MEKWDYLVLDRHLKEKDFSKAEIKFIHVLFEKDIDNRKALANTLFVSKKTVSMHINHIAKKLNMKKYFHHKLPYIILYCIRYLRR